MEQGPNKTNPPGSPDTAACVVGDNGLRAPRKKLGPFVLTFVLMAVTWVILSGKFDSFHMSLGVICCLIVSWASSDLLFPTAESARVNGSWLRFALYIPWLMIEILKANIWVLFISLHPRMMDKIDPQVIRFKSRLKGDMARLTFANSITLTPGTITVDVDVDGTFIVHALDWHSASGLPGEMQNKIAKVYGED